MSSFESDGFSFSKVAASSARHSNGPKIACKKKAGYASLKCVNYSGMSSYRANIFFLALVVCALPSGRAGAGLIVSSWDLASAVQGSSQGNNQVHSLLVTNPFNGTHLAQVGASYVDTAHDFSWAADDGMFQVNSIHHMEQLVGSVLAGGLVNFSVTADSILTYSGRYDYSWPSDVFGTSGLSALVYDYTDDVIHVEDGVTGGNVGLDPPYGSLVFNASALLTAGHNYAFRYGAATQVFNPSSPGTFGTAIADITITISPIPEPDALLPLVLGVLFLRRRPCH